MRLVRGLHNLHKAYDGCVATIGNFDGVHLGHQAVIGQVVEKAAELDLPATIITFEPQPQEYFTPDLAPARLTRFREKLIILRRFAVDQLLCLQFNARLAELTANEFIEQVLVQGLKVAYLVVGDDFCFGKGRQGNFQTLVDAGRTHGFKVVSMHTYEVDEQRVSSTRVRDALAAGDMPAANALLGRGFRLSGRVAHGQKKGRTIGFPTANIFLHRKTVPLAGVYAVEMYGLEGEPLPGVANIGTRPTVDGSRTILEAHLFDFDQDIYGKHVQIEFLHRLRDEKRFESFAELKAQIEQDVQHARNWFK